jgi:hypothetical protein
MTHKRCVVIGDLLWTSLVLPREVFLGKTKKDVQRDAVHPDLRVGIPGGSQPGCN